MTQNAALVGKDRSTVITTPADQDGVCAGRTFCMQDPVINCDGSGTVPQEQRDNQEPVPVPGILFRFDTANHPLPVF